VISKLAEENKYLRRLLFEKNNYSGVNPGLKDDFEEAYHNSLNQIGTNSRTSTLPPLSSNSRVYSQQGMEEFEKSNFSKNIENSHSEWYGDFPPSTGYPATYSSSPTNASVPKTLIPLLSLDWVARQKVWERLVFRGILLQQKLKYTIDNMEVDQRKRLENTLAYNQLLSPNITASIYHSMEQQPPLQPSISTKSVEKITEKPVLPKLKVEFLRTGTAPSISRSRNMSAFISGTGGYAGVAFENQSHNDTPHSPAFLIGSSSTSSEVSSSPASLRGLYPPNSIVPFVRLPSDLELPTSSIVKAPSRPRSSSSGTTQSPRKTPRNVEKADVLANKGKSRVGASILPSDIKSKRRFQLDKDAIYRTGQFSAGFQK
jgi:hypothetical protein